MYMLIVKWATLSIFNANESYNVLIMDIYKHLADNASPSEWWGINTCSGISLLCLPYLWHLYQNASASALVAVN